jgi:hypothetical protein
MTFYTSLKNFSLVGLFIFFISTKSTLFGQEFNCQVTVITEAKVEVSSAEQEIIKQLKQAMTDFMNDTRWTEDNFKTEERINLNIQLQIRSIPSTGNYQGAMQISYTRPVFNSSYNSPIFNFQDDNVNISYQRGAVLQYAENQFRDNITSILAFYAYFILGTDYDSFSLKGGTSHFLKAQQIVTNAQNGGGSGWKANETGKRNRYWLVENILQPVYDPLRECNYLYHRKGMDMLYENKVQAKKNMYDALNKMTTVASQRPNTINIINFMFSKISEFKGVLSDSEQAEKTEFVNLLKKIDSGNTSRYLEILN